MDINNDALAFALVQVVMLVGLFGLLIPIFPGMLVMWLAALGYGLLAGFSPLGIALFVLITLLGVGGSLVDNVLMGAGARKGGASWLSIFVALAAGLIGTLIFPPVGGLIAAPLAVLLVEYSRVKNWDLAWKAFKGLAAGWGLSVVARFGIGVVIMALWWLWAWRG